MSRITRRALQRMAAAWVVLVCIIAVLSPFLAADRPIVLVWQGKLHVFPNLIGHERLRGLSGDELRGRMSRDDWAIWPPVAHDPDAVRTHGMISPLEPPSGRHWLGTDDRGRDVMARLIHGSRTTLVIAAGAALVALLLGLVLALLAVRARPDHAARPRSRPGRMAGNLVDASVVMLCDAVAAMPALLVVVAAQGLIGRASLSLAILLIALPRGADLARTTRGVLMAALAQPWCEAAFALGASRMRVLVRHALPQALPHIIVATAITAATAVLGEAALGFLGFGAPPPTASWGELLKQAHENGLRWHLMVPSGLAVALLSAALGALAQPDRRP